VSKFRGLPNERKMRHDAHFVEEITSHRDEAVGRMIELERVVPNPHQPRKQFGDLSELVASIKEKGILEPILVRRDQESSNFMIIAGERRFQAARLAGLTRVPCIEVDVDNRGMLEISLVENLQRKDLTPFEEAAALTSLVEQFRYTHEEIARKLGRSRTVITEALSLAKLPADVMERCRRADIASKSMLLQVVRQPTVDEMHRLVDKISGEGMTRDDARSFRRTAGTRRRPSSYTFRYQPEGSDFRLRLTFRRPEVDREELLGVLRELIRRIEDGEPTGTPAAGADSTTATASA